MELDAYLDRIGLRQRVRPDEEGLFALHAAHLAAIPYENLDIQLGQPKRLEEAAFFARLVDDRRGGWCYEMNGLFCWALRQLGFRVERVGGAVARDVLGEPAVGNHMVLLVDLGRRFVADVGLGDGPTFPFPLEPRRWSEGRFDYALDRQDDDWWRFHNHRHGMAPSFDFLETPRALDWYRDQSEMLQTADLSPFVGLGLVIRRDPSRIRALRDTTYIEVDGDEKREQTIDSPAEYAERIVELMGHDLAGDTDRLWKKVSARAAERRSASIDESGRSGE